MLRYNMHTEMGKHKIAENKAGGILYAPIPS